MCSSDLALLCHGQLATHRPDAANLTEFYLWLALGGALGGLFNGLLAPMLFNAVVEYPLALVLTAALALGPAMARWSDGLWPLALGIGVAGIFWFLGPNGSVAPQIVFGLGAVACFLFSRRPLRFALGAAALLLAGQTYDGQRGRLLYRERSFFGVHRITKIGRAHV